MRIGELSPVGLVDVGMRCPHECQWCFYRYQDFLPRGKFPPPNTTPISQDYETRRRQSFHGLHHYPWRDVSDCMRLIRAVKDWGMQECDFTGGEATLHPNIEDMVDYATKLGMVVRILTVGQHLMDRGAHGMNRLERLQRKGLRDLLISVQGVDDESLRAACGRASKFERLRSIIDYLDNKLAEGKREPIPVQYKTNTQVCGITYKNLPKIARFLAKSRGRVHHLNFTKKQWGLSKMPAVDWAELKVEFKKCRPFVVEAVEILKDAGKEFVLRECPPCVFREYLPHVSQMKQNPLDPNEERNGCKGEPDGSLYGKDPFLIYPTLVEFNAHHVHKIENHPACAHWTHLTKCQRCSLRFMCDGVDKEYIYAHGDSEFQPVYGPLVTDLLYFRRTQPKQFDTIEYIKPQYT